MKTIILSMSLLATIGFTACTNQHQPDQSSQHVIKKERNMKNLVSIIEIPASDLGRAIQFYSNILGVTIEEAEMGDVKMGILPGEEGTVNVVLAHGTDYKPTANGNVLYLNGGNNLQVVLDKVETNGGKIIMPKTQISPEMGYFALFIDTEGNKLGLHSAQ